VNEIIPGKVTEVLQRSWFSPFTQFADLKTGVAAFVAPVKALKVVDQASLNLATETGKRVQAYRKRGRRASKGAGLPAEEPSEGDRRVRQGHRGSTGVGRAAPEEADRRLSHGGAEARSRSQGQG
jgi:hypothetical protein